MPTHRSAPAWTGLLPTGRPAGVFVADEAPVGDEGRAIADMMDAQNTRRWCVLWSEGSHRAGAPRCDALEYEDDRYAFLAFFPSPLSPYMNEEQPAQLPLTYPDSLSRRNLFWI